MELSDDDLKQFAPADRREVDPPVQVDMATWSHAGQLDWWVKERREWWGRVRGANGRQRWITRAALSAAPGKRREWNTLGLLGHLTMTTAGVSFASINSTVIVSVVVSWPLASSVTLDKGSRSSTAGFQAPAVFPALLGHSAGRCDIRLEAFEQLWSAIAEIGRDPSTRGYRRFAWTEADLRMREWFSGECLSRGLDLIEDRVGNQWAWWGDPDSSPTGGVVTGSHLDSVPDGGAFDGPLGVVSALLAIDRLRSDGFRPRRPIGVVNFIDEEGARFGVSCAGSRMITGVLSPDRARALRDVDGNSMAEAMRAAGRVPEQLGPDPEALARIGSFIELHIEQGRGLIDLSRAVAVGSGLWAHGRWRIEIPGEANHAGTTRLNDRRDAVIGCARAVLAARAAAEAHGTLATVGKISIQPGGVNAIASSATAWLDARAAAEPALRATLAQIEAEVGRSGAAVTEESWTPQTAFDDALVSRLAGLLDGAPVMTTGAGHDAGILANAGVPAAMIFVRNPTGASHTPAEWAEPEDCLAGVDALTTVLADLAGAEQ